MSGENMEDSDKIFTEAFEKAQKVEDITPKPDEQPPQKTDEEIAAEAQAAEEARRAEEAEKAKGDGEKPKQKPGESDESYEQRWKTLQGIYRHEKDEWAAEKAKIMAEYEEVKSKVPKPAENKEDEHPALKDLLAKLDLTDEQKAQLQEYDEEFDVVSKMEGLKRERAMAKLKAEMLQEIQGFKKEVQTQLEPATKLVKETAENREVAERNSHFQYIRESHPDFEKYRDDGTLLEWIESKPAYMRNAMKVAYTQGSAENVVELLDGFKAENNISTEGSVVRINKAKADRKAALTPPTTRRSAVNASMGVAEDFESAFAEALNKEN